MEQSLVSRYGTIRLRPIADEDLEALVAFYDGLSAEARHLRFCGARRLRREDVAGLMAVDDGGVGLVATLEQGEIVGHAHIVTRRDSGSEFGMVVRDDLQGHGVGRALLAALLDAAGRQGIDALEADVLAVNRPMMRLVAEGGYAILERDGCGSQHVIVATRGGMPAWPARHTSPRVLIESRGWGLDDRPLRAAGYSVAICPGARPAAATCPLAAGERCPLADGADAIVCRLPLDAAGEAVLRAHRGPPTGAPVCADISDPDEILAWVAATLPHTGHATGVGAGAPASDD